MTRVLNKKTIFTYTTFLIFSLISYSCLASEVYVQKTDKGDWQLYVDEKPYFIRGLTYGIQKVGQSPNTEWIDWQKYDYNNNGKVDGPYDSWVDKNANNIQDNNEPVIGDFQLMKEMGVNTIRWYHNAFFEEHDDKALFRDLYNNYGVMVAVGDFLGAYAIASGATWEEGTDYTNSEQRERMKESVKNMVIKHKDEPYLLLWIIGNENNYKFTKINAHSEPKAYAKFINEVAKIIHELDPHHPVAFVNGDITLLQHYVTNTPEIDIFGTNAYRGPNGFGDLWTRVKKTYDKPILVTEFGSNTGLNEEEQAIYHKGNWINIEENRSEGSGQGNSIGGMVFEWSDRWWPAGDINTQENMGLKGEFSFYSWSEEYSGICSQGDGKNSPFMRRLKKTYTMYRDELWKN